MTCTRPRLLTLDEARALYGSELRDETAALLQQYGGQVVLGGPVEFPNNVVPYDAIVAYLHAGAWWSDEFVTDGYVHEFVDTGTQRSWCKCCDADGVWDRAMGKFVAKRSQ